MAWKVTEISNEELRAIPDGTADLDSPFIKPRILEMEWRIAEKQLEAANKLGAFTKQLVMATRVLWLVTGALFLATIGQIVVSLLKK